MVKELCMHCMTGYVVNGVCNRCGATKQKQGERKTDALPCEYRLHDRYILGDVLGWGGFGITYIAWDSVQKCPVAVKELYPSSFVNRENRHTVRPRADAVQIMEQMKESFTREAMTIIQLQHVSGIVKMFHVFDDNNTIYFSMELLHGSDFRKFLRKRCGQNQKMSWGQLSEMIRPVMLGLDALHREGLIHRDISPDNIFICNDGSARLIDFGLARKFQGNTSFTVSLKECFAPWEQYDSHGNQGPWTDVYAMGVTLYVALSGELPPTAPERKTNAYPTISLSEICPDVPSNVVRCIEKAMSIEIEDRYENMGQFCDALFQADEPVPPPPQQVEEYPMLVCLQGALTGCAWQIRPNTAIRIGRSNNGSSLEVALPIYSRGVSKLHCTIMLAQDGTFLVRDEGSTFGTIVNGATLQPNVWYSLLKESWIMVGQQIFQIQ